MQLNWTFVITSNCNRWVSSARCSKLYEVFSWSTDIHILTKCRWWPQMNLAQIQMFANWPVSHVTSYCSLSRVLHVTLANWQKFGFDFHPRSSPSAFSECMDINRPAEYLIQLATPCWRDSTRLQQLSTAAIIGFQFGLYHVVAPLSFLRSISLASVFTSLSIFSSSDLLQILRRQAAFSFAVLCTIMFISSTRDTLFFCVVIFSQR